MVKQSKDLITRKVRQRSPLGQGAIMTEVGHTTDLGVQATFCFFIWLVVA